MTPTLIAAALVAGAAHPVPGALKTFADWIVGCDNGRACQAVALIPESSENDAYLMLVITREPGATAKPVLIVPSGDTPRGTRMTLRIDGKIVASVIGQAGDTLSKLPLAGALAAALADGKTATLTSAAGKVIATASLDGLAATFRYMDAQQQRVGTTTALRATGPRPASAVPAPPALPIIVAPAPAAAAPRTLTVEAAMTLIGPDNAKCDYANASPPPAAYRLDAKHSLVLVDHPCGNGAYNMFTTAYVLDQAGRPTPARFDVSPGMGDENDDSLTNAGWTPGTRRLTAYIKGRGIGDCGTSQNFAWDGTRFRLVELAEMGECRGSTDYITTWRARVVAR